LAGLTEIARALVNIDMCGLLTLNAASMPRCRGAMQRQNKSHSNEDWAAGLQNSPAVYLY
jgi:hypothetical protein